MQTVLYARYSTDLQNNLSTQDQLSLLRERCAREGWQIVGTYCDEEISGRAGISAAQRPGINALIQHVEQGGVDQVLAESTDRVARHGGDLQAIREIIEHVGCRLFTLSDGVVDDITGAIKGLMDSRFLKELAAKVRRGQRGNHARGKNPGGKAYGYRVLKPIGPDGEIIRGLLAIDEEEAEIIRRIYDEFIAGMSPFTICKRLNEEGVPGPAGGRWVVSTLTGDRRRANGIFRNNLYRGIMIFNRTQRVYEPRSRKLIRRANPPGEWLTKEHPELRIITDEQWNAVQQHYDQFDGVVATHQRRPKKLLSGMGTCSVCGGNWILIDYEKWGCSNNKTHKTCSNTRTLSTRQFEKRVLGGLRDQMLDPASVSRFVKRYTEQFAERTAELSKKREQLERRLQDAERKVARIVDAIAEGAGDFPEFRAKLTEARQERAAAQAELNNVEEISVVRLHPGLGDHYRKSLESMGECLSEEGIARERAMTAIRSLIDGIVITPRPDKGVDIMIAGRLNQMLNLATGLPPQMGGYRWCRMSGPDDNPLSVRAVV